MVGGGEGPTSTNPFPNASVSREGPISFCISIMVVFLRSMPILLDPVAFVVEWWGTAFVLDYRKYIDT
jgi:hypothetical protein